MPRIASIFTHPPAIESGRTLLIDTVTRRLTAAWRNKLEESSRRRGSTICTCGAYASVNCYLVGTDHHQRRVDALCIHYTAFHRSSLSQAQLIAILSLTNLEAEPTKEELYYSHRTSMLLA